MGDIVALNNLESGADKLKIPGGGNNLGARDFCPPLSDFCPPLRASQGGAMSIQGGAKFLNRHFNSLYLER